MHMLLLALILACVLGTGAAEAAKPGTLPTYTVRKGDSLLGIARKTGVKAKEIKRLNHLRANLIHPGQVLVLGEGSKPKPKTSARPVAKDEEAPPVLTTVGKEVDPGTTVVTSAGESAEASTAIMDQPSPMPAVATQAEPISGTGLPEASANLQQVALAYLATPYRFGAESRKSTDCSGFIQQVFRECGLELPRTAREQFAVGSVVPDGEWQIGDLLFFRTYARYPSHVGIYLGDGKMIHASRSHRKVVVSSVERSYFRKRYLGARRVVWVDPVANLIDNLAGKVEEVNEEGLFESDLAAPPLPVEAEPVSTPVAVPSPQASLSPAAATPSG